MKKLLIICSILILFTGKVDSFGLTFLTNIQDMIGLVTDISDLATGRHDLTAGNLFRKKTDATLVAVTKLSEQISELTRTINVRMEKLMSAVLLNLPKAVQLANLFRKLIQYLGRIDELYEDYLFYISEYGKINEYTIEEYSYVCTSHNYGDVPDILKQTRNMFLPGRGDQGEDSLLEVMVASLQEQEESEHCNQLKSTQQQLYDLYEAVTIAEIKGHSMAIYAYGLLSIYQNVSFDHEIERVTGQTISRCTEYLSAIYNVVGLLKRDVFLCDPPKHIKGETYVALNALTRIIVHETMIVGCDKGCRNIDHTSYSWPFVTADEYWDPNQPCRGRMSKCDSVGTTRLCELPPENDKRYSWIQTDKIGTLGTKDDCTNGTIRTINEYGDWGECTTCFCECSEQKPESTAIRAISLRPQLTDVDDNMVVTGVRFEQKDMMIHVQIEEGKLLSSGQIDMNSVHWVTLEDFRYSYDDGNFFRVGLRDEKRLKPGTDYQFIHAEQRDVNLDIVYSQESNYVVTGLKMSQDPDNSEAVQLDLFITPFIFSSGSLIPSNKNPSKWITYKDMPDHDRPFTKRKEIWVNDLRRGDDYYDNIPKAENDFSFIWFATSSRYSDAGQSTVPFFDRQTNAPFPRVPLTGISLYHRGKKDSAGFIGFKLQTVNFHEHMNIVMQPEFAKQRLKSFEKLLNTSMVSVYN